MNSPHSSAPEAAKLLELIQKYSGPKIAIMEVCGTHTVAIARMGLRGLLPDNVRLISGPGCPVCVTPVGVFDEAIRLVREGVILTTYGDALRVPGTHTTLERVRAEGGEITPVYSVTDALKVARDNPEREVVFLGLGFETTSPSAAHAILTAKKRGLTNFSVLSAHKALMPAMQALLADPLMEIGAFLCPGHASMVIGSDAYLDIARTHKIPCAVAGFQPEQVLLGMLYILRQIERGEAKVENAYPGVVTPEGNRAAMALLKKVFVLADSRWRGLGELPNSGYMLAPEFEAFDTRKKLLDGQELVGEEPAGCKCAEVLRGRMGAQECPLFAKVCTPEAPVGACMVSSEGACGAHYRYRGIE
jgi:hydrogenase expression/formation protein HypD